MKIELLDQIDLGTTVGPAAAKLRQIVPIAAAALAAVQGVRAGGEAPAPFLATDVKLA